MTRRLEPAAAVCASAFMMLFGYALARPASESLFLEVHTAAGLPAAWIGVALGAAMAVAAYSRAVARLPLSRVLVGAEALSAAALVVLLALPRGHASTLLLYVWKDVHIVVLLEALWSFASLVFSMQQARWIYGVFCAAGSLGGILGNLGGGALAGWLGTERMLRLLVPVFLIQALLALWLGRATGEPRPRERAPLGMREGITLLRASRYLVWMLAMVGIVQLVVNLVDFQYSAVMQAAYPDVDRRTAVGGQVYALIDGLSLALQLGSGLVLRAIGLEATLLLVPLFMAALLGVYAAMPSFTAMAALKVASKALDYSLLRAAKEMLYIPLAYAEKTRGKALIDMLTYRVAKAGASLVVHALAPIGAGAGVLGGTALLLAGWLGSAAKVIHRYRSR